MVESGAVWGKLSLHVYQISKWGCRGGNWIYESVAQVEGSAEDITLGVINTVFKAMRPEEITLEVNIRKEEEV